MWLTTNRQLPLVSTQLNESLMQALSQVHASTISASVRRKGEWPNLEYAHQLGYGARRVAVVAVGPKFEGFKAIAENLLQDPELADAHDLVRQTQRIMEAGIEDILRKSQLMGSAVQANDLKADLRFWKGCENEWGRGSGYKPRVSKHTTEWFDLPNHLVYQERIQALIEREWAQVLDRLTPLLEIE